MSYVRKLTAHDETMIGIARLHWIYVLKGIMWFLMLAGAGWFMNSAMNSMLMSFGETVSSARMSLALFDLSNGIMYFMMGGGFLIFLSYVVDVLVTEIGLTDKRVMHKTGFIFVKVKQVDIEEIRGEQLDLGWFGRLLGYGYVMLDCRFIGDIRLPAVENPERFLRALHTARTEAQDALNLVMGKSNVKVPINMVAPDQGEQSVQPKTPRPEIQPGQPATQPEVQPDQTPSRPEIEPEPTPHAPPPPSTPPPQPGVVPPPQQPTPAPGPNPQPPLQPPTGALDPNAVAQVVAQVTPQIAQQVVEQLKEQGMLNKPAPENDNDEDIDNDLIAVFDDARFKDEDPHARHDRLEHAIH